VGVWRQAIVNPVNIYFNSHTGARFSHIGTLNANILAYLTTHCWLYCAALGHIENSGSNT
jgi:hypothetical protein